MTPKISHLIFCFFSYGFCVLFFWLNRKVVYPSNVFPYLVVGLLAGFTSLVFIREMILNKNTTEENLGRQGKALKVIAMGLISLIYVVLINLIGFYAISLAYLISAFNLFRPAAKRSWQAVLMSLGNALLIMLLVFLMFRYGLKVPTPKGIFI